MQNMPKTIYLNTGVEDFGSEFVDFEACVDVSWSTKPVGEGDVEYRLVKENKRELKIEAEDYLLFTRLIANPHLDYDFKKILEKRKISTKQISNLVDMYEYRTICNFLENEDLNDYIIDDNEKEAIIWLYDLVMKLQSQSKNATVLLNEIAYVLEDNKN